MAHNHACTDPQHHVDDGDAFVREVERVCRQRGLRLTPIRANALRLIAAAGRPVKAYDLLDQMKATHDAAAPPTIADIGATAHVSDDPTVKKSEGSCKAGVVFDVDERGVWVRIGA